MVAAVATAAAMSEAAALAMVLTRRRPNCIRRTAAVTVAMMIAADDHEGETTASDGGPYPDAVRKSADANNNADYEATKAANGNPNPTSVLCRVIAPQTPTVTDPRR